MRQRGYGVSSAHAAAFALLALAPLPLAAARSLRSFGNRSVLHVVEGRRLHTSPDGFSYGDGGGDGFSYGDSSGAAMMAPVSYADGQTIQTVIAGEWDTGSTGGVTEPGSTVTIVGNQLNLPEGTLTLTYPTSDQVQISLGETSVEGTAMSGGKLFWSDGEMWSRPTCSVTDGSGLSSTYPCTCGSSAVAQLCTIMSACTSSTGACVPFAADSSSAAAIPAAINPAEAAANTQYTDMWKAVGWHDQVLCGTLDTEPQYREQLRTIINGSCGDVTNLAHHHCACNLAKAHSCYVHCAGDLGGGETKNAYWQICMANCYPTPSCSQMCSGGLAACETKCVERYKPVVDKYKPMFAGVSITG